jgi:hypothetical protein
MVEHRIRPSFRIVAYAALTALLVLCIAAQDAPPQKVVKEQQRPTPVLPDEQRADDEAEAKAELTITAFKKGGTEALWHALRRDSDPAVRAYLVDRLPSSGVVSPEAIVTRSRTAADAGERAALTLILGGYTEQQLNRSRRHKLAPAIINIYRTDPDSEVHSAADWLLRHKNDHPLPAAFFQEDYPFLHAAEGASQPRPEWEERSALLVADRELAEKPPARRDWAVNSEGHTMVTIRPIGAFLMGARPNETRRAHGEQVHRIRIPRSFAIANKEVTVAQFQRYLNDSGLRSRWSAALKQRFPRLIRRGGSWSYDKETMRSAHRGAPNGYQLENRMDSVGFRVARTVQAASSDNPVRRLN